MKEIEKAAQEFINRRDRITHPDGNFDKARRFELSEIETCACCEGIRTPSRAFPFSMMTHARSARHIASLFNVDVTEMKRLARRMQKEAETLSE